MIFRDSGWGVVGGANAAEAEPASPASFASTPALAVSPSAGSFPARLSLSSPASFFFPNASEYEKSNNGFNALFPLYQCVIAASFPSPRALPSSPFALVVSKSSGKTGEPARKSADPGVSVSQGARQ